MSNLMWPLVTFGITAIGILVGVFVVWRMLEDRKSGFPAKDERTRRITGKAATYALYIGMYSTIVLLFVNIISREFYGSYAFEEGYALIASLLVYSLPYLGLRWYFDRKGDF